MQLIWTCQAELFRLDVEGAGDLRLNVRLFMACRKEARDFCADVPPDNGQAEDCLEEHMSQLGFGDRCRCVSGSAPIRRGAGLASKTLPGNPAHLFCMQRTHAHMTFACLCQHCHQAQCTCPERRWAA